MTRCWVEVSRSRLLSNLESIRSRIPPTTTVTAVVKANAYGHGVEQVAGLLRGANVRSYAVATLEEAVQLRQWIQDAPVLVLGGCLPGQEAAFAEHGLTAGHFTLDAPPQGVDFELKIDTGMTRLGIPWTEVGRFVKRYGMPSAVYSHFAAADCDPGFTHLQLKRFLEATKGLDCDRHLACSAALTEPAALLDRVRVGLSLYGVQPCESIDFVQPVLRWKARILTVYQVPSGRTIGYGCTFRTQRPSRIAVLPVGYADGYSRGFSSRGLVRVRNRLAPVAGRVSMDLTSVDVTDIPGVRAGEEVILLDWEENSPLSANHLAQSLGTIPYEVLTSIGARVERTLVE